MFLKKNLNNQEVFLSCLKNEWISEEKLNDHQAHTLFLQLWENLVCLITHHSTEIHQPLSREVNFINRFAAPAKRQAGNAEQH